MRNKTLAVLSLSTLAGLGSAQLAHADDLGEITLFGQEYEVQRFDYADLVRWPDPLAPGFELQLIEVEGAHSLGNDRILLSTDAGDSLLSYKNWVVEVRITRDPAGKATGLAYVRTVLVNDPNTPALGGFDLSPCGITVNTGSRGLGANGNLMIGDSEANGVRGYSLANGAEGASFTGGTQNDSFDDLAYVPTNDLVYTINEDGFALVSFTPDGTFVASTPIPGLGVLGDFTRGSPKGMVFLPDAPTVPAAIRRAGGSLLLTLDDNNPGLQAFDLSGNVVGTEVLTTNPAGGGTPLLAQTTGCDLPLQFEAVAFDAATGELFLVNESAFFDCAGFYLLTPVTPACPVDFNDDGFVDFFDFDDFVACFEGGPCPAGKTADFNNDGFTDFFDFDDFVLGFESGC
jgi:hypothetical protein